MLPLPTSISQPNPTPSRSRIPDQVMDMRPANVNVTKGADVAGSQESRQAGQGEGGKEADRSKKKAAFGPIGDMLMKKLTHAWNVQNQEDSSSGDNNRNREDPGCGRHELPIVRFSCLRHNEICHQSRPRPP